jgi:hypothetical protein
VFGGGDNDGEFFSDLLSFSVPFDPVVEVEWERQGDAMILVDWNMMGFK